MRIIPLSNSNDLQEVAETILRNAMLDPKAAQLMETLINDPQADRRALFHTAFAMGAASTMNAWMQGSLVQIGNLIQGQSKS